MRLVNGPRIPQESLYKRLTRHLHEREKLAFRYIAPVIAHYFFVYNKVAMKYAN